MKRSIIPQYIEVLSKSEINSINISFGIVDERYPNDGSCILESKNSVLFFNYNGIQVILIFFKIIIIIIIIVIIIIIM